MPVQQLPDLSKLEAGGITLVLAAWLVIQALKRQFPRLSRWLPVAVTGLAAVLVAAYLWVPALFTWLAGTIVTAALILGGSAMIKGLVKPPDKPQS